MSSAGAVVILLAGCAYDFDHFATLGSGGNATSYNGGAPQGGTGAASGASSSSGGAGARASGGGVPTASGAGGSAGSTNGGGAMSAGAAGTVNAGQSSVGGAASGSGGVAAGSSGKGTGGADATGGPSKGGTTSGGGTGGNAGGTGGGGGMLGFDCDELSGTIANQHCYFAVGRGAGLSWRAAKAACEIYSAHLVTITSSAEEELVQSRFFPAVSDYWIGLALNDTSGDTPPRTCKSAPSTCPFRWVTGEALSYADWATRGGSDSEPNFSGPCVRIQLSDLKWADYGCSMGQLPGICEFE
jgi:hypothetical protein